VIVDTAKIGRKCKLDGQIFCLTEEMLSRPGGFARTSKGRSEGIVTQSKHEGEMAMTKRNRARLNAKLERNLSSYARAATAAGVGILALVSPVSAKIVYTPANQPLGGRVPVDFNNDGTPDIVFNTYSFIGGEVESWVLRVYPGQRDNVVWGNANASASALPQRILIGNNPEIAGLRSFWDLAGWAAGCPGGTSCFSATGGPWANVVNRYLGVKFLIKGKPHFGWARLTVNVEVGSISGTLTGYAYETIANQPILIFGTGVIGDPSSGEKRDAPAATVLPPPGSLGFLAAGAPGLKHWRVPRSTDDQ
jgi:hypothetical protein